MVEKPSRAEINELERIWGLAETSTRKGRLTKVHIIENNERCKGEGVAVIVDFRGRVVLLRPSSPDVPKGSDR